MTLLAIELSPLTCESSSEFLEKNDKEKREEAQHEHPPARVLGEYIKKKKKRKLKNIPCPCVLHRFTISFRADTGGSLLLPMARC